MSVPQLASVDGRVSPTSEARVPIADDGFLRGDGVFEMIRLYRGRPYALAEHLERLERSATAIELPLDRGLLEGEIAALLGEAGAVDAALRLVLTRGGRRIALIEPLPAWPESVRLATVTYAPSIILTNVKSISYAANMEATRRAVRLGADEAVLVRPDGIVLEAPTAAIFWAPAEGPLRTPSLESGILESITRARIVEQLEVEEGEFQVSELRGASEAFIASTTREVQAVSAIDRSELATPGPRTVEARDAFARALERALG